MAVGTGVGVGVGTGVGVAVGTGVDIGCVSIGIGVDTGMGVDVATVVLVGGESVGIGLSVGLGTKVAVVAVLEVNVNASLVVSFTTTAWLTTKATFAVFPLTSYTDPTHSFISQPASGKTSMVTGSPETY